MKMNKEYKKSIAWNVATKDNYCEAILMAIPTLIIEWFSQPCKHSKNAECREYLQEGKLIVQD